MQYDVVIVGTGHGGAQAAIALRQNGFAGTIAMLGKDSEPPYERPPLSKDYLSGEKTFERILIRPENFWADKGIALMTCAEVVSVEPVHRRVTLTDGRETGYGKMIWSTGASPRRLTCEGGDLSGVHTIRDKADIDALVEQLRSGQHRGVVIGGGYIGLEAAAVLRKLKCEVVIVELQDRLLARVSGAVISRFFENEHRRRGVEIRLGTGVSRIIGANGIVEGVELDDGGTIACDLVVVGIGVEPAIAPLVAAGAHAANGVRVDAFCRTNLPGVYAIGDCAAHANAFAEGTEVRLESVQNANDMAMTVAKDLTGNPEPYETTPWFWSNQYDVKLQTVGLCQGHDESVVRGKPDSRSFSVIYLRKGEVIALDCVNAVKDYVQGRKLVEVGAVVGANALADVERPLKELWQSAT